MTNETLEKLVKECGVNLYDTEVVTENGRKIYRVYLTSKDGINLDDCAKVTQIISPILDLEPPVSGKYFLEVSSPGIERKLTKPNHFIYSIGQIVKIKAGESYEGKLVNADEVHVEVEIDGEIKKIAQEDISKARTVVVW